MKETNLGKYVVETWVRATLGKSILIQEPITVTEWVLRTLDRKSHVAVRDIHVHLCVRGTRYKRCLVEWILASSFGLTEKMS